jgi:hypothetical protein
MILKSNSKIVLKKSPKKRKFLILYFILTSSVGVLFLIFFFTSHAVNLKTKKTLDYLSKAGRIEYIYIFDIAYKAIKSNFYKFDRIDLDIKFEDIVILEKERQAAIERGTLGRNKSRLSKVPATIKYENKKIKSKIRLKGDREMHWGKKKNSSYNVYLSKDNYIFGVNNFSIQKPAIRNYIHEWIFNEMMGDLDIIKIQYKFFELYINGANNGLYVFEEKMGKEILERNKRRNGPIVNTINEYNQNYSENNHIFSVYDEKYWNLPENIELAKTAIKKIKEFYSGKRTASETFDLEKMAAFFAVLDATYTTHALFFSSKLYYNPLSGLFEPIPRDGHRKLPNYHKFNMNYYDNILIDSIYKGESRSELGYNLEIPDGGGRQWWINKLFINKDGKLNYDFYSLYVKYLTKISSLDYLDSFFSKRKNQIEKINSKIYSDHFFYAGTRNFTWGLYYFKKDDLYHRAKVVRERLVTDAKIFSAVVDSDKNLVIDVAYDYYSKVKNQIRLDSLEIVHINCIAINESYNETSFNQTYEKKIIQKPINPFSTTKIKLDFLNLEKSQCKDVKIVDKKLNRSYFVKIDNLNSFHNFKEFKSSNHKLYLNFFERKSNDLFLKDEIVKIDKNIYIPGGLNVIINSGQEIILTNNSFIISDSRWIVDGGKKEIIISGLENDLGGGIMISNSSKQSYFNNVKFSHLGGLEPNNELTISGAINFYKTDVSMKNITFEKTLSEDAMNIISSKFNIKDIKFTQSRSDSIDLDFSDGSMSDARFVNIGNDAIDFSGSNVEIKNIYFEKIGDKLISVGENSNINISNINAQNSLVGIASKDGSIVKASNIKMKNVKLPFLSFNKKSEYAPARMYLSEINIDEFEEKWLIDKKSKIYHENSEVGKISKNIIPIVYEKKFNLLEKTKYE